MSTVDKNGHNNHLQHNEISQTHSDLLKPFPSIDSINLIFDQKLKIEDTQLLMKELLSNIIDKVINNQIDIELESESDEEFDNPFHHEDGCPFGWKPPNYCDQELSGNAILCSCIDNFRSSQSQMKMKKNKEINLDNVTSSCCSLDEDNECFCLEGLKATYLLQQRSQIPQSKRFTKPAYISNGRPVTMNICCETNSGDRQIKNETNLNSIIFDNEDNKCNSYASSLSFSSEYDVEEIMQEAEFKKTSPKKYQVLPSTPINPRTSSRGISREHLHKLLVELSAEQNPTSNTPVNLQTSIVHEEMKQMVNNICEKISVTDEIQFQKKEIESPQPQVMPFIIHLSEEESSFSELDESDNEIENRLRELLEEESHLKKKITQRSKFYIKRMYNNELCEMNRCLISNSTEEADDENETVLNIIEPDYGMYSDGDEYQSEREELIFEAEDPYPELTMQRKDGLYWTSVGLVKDFRCLPNGLDLMKEENGPSNTNTIGDNDPINSKELPKGIAIKNLKQESTKVHREKKKKYSNKIWRRFINIFKSKR